jgi:predicted HicB family RNase H-like nuclease
MKTTLELPDELFRSAKARAAQEGVSLKEYVASALREKGKRPANGTRSLG